MFTLLGLIYVMQGVEIEWQALPTLKATGADGEFEIGVQVNNFEQFSEVKLRCYIAMFINPEALAGRADPTPVPLQMLMWNNPNFWDYDLSNNQTIFMGTYTMDNPIFNQTISTHYANLWAAKCSVKGYQAAQNGTVAHESIALPVFTNPAMVLAENVTEIHKEPCFKDLQVYQNPSIWFTYQNHTPHYDFDSMNKKSAKFGGTSMGDYSGCMELDNAVYCSLRVPSLSWTGLCLPDSCDIHNVQNSFRVSAAQSICGTATTTLYGMALQQNETLAGLDNYLVALGIPKSQLDNGGNDIIKLAALGLVGSTSQQFQQSVTVWMSALAFTWECGDQAKWPGVVAAWWIPFFLLLGVVSFSTLLDSQWTYKLHMLNKKVVNSGYEQLIEDKPITSEPVIHPVEGSTNAEGTTVAKLEVSPRVVAADRPSAPPTDIWEPQTVMDHIIVAFSLQRSWKTFLKTRGGALSFFDGIRVYAAWWVILGHTEFWVLATTWFGNGNAIYPSKYTSDSTSLWWQIIPGAFFAVDTFFFIGGFFATFIMVKKAAKMAIPTFGMGIPIFYLERWLRLVPSIFFAMLAQAFLLPNIGSGPLWPYHGLDSRCKDAWWSELFMLTSWPTYDADLKSKWSCLGVTWYLTCDFFYFTITPFVVLAYSYGHRFAGYAAAAICIIGFSAKYTVLAEDGHIHVSPLFNTGTGWSYTYDNPRCRGAPYFWGVMCGMIYDHLKSEYKDFRISGLQSMVTQTTAFIIIAICVFLPYWDIKDATCAVSVPGCDFEDPWGQSMHTFFSVYSRLFFVVGLSMYAVCWIYGPETSYTRQFMTFPFWPQLGKLSFLMYLWHPFWLSWFYGTQPSPVYYSRLNMLVWWFGICCLAGLTALFFHLCVEVPCNHICNQAPWRTKKKKST